MNFFELLKHYFTTTLIKISDTSIVMACRTSFHEEELPEALKKENPFYED